MEVDDDFVRWELRKHIKKTYKTAKQFAFLNSVSQAYVSAILSGKRAIPDWMLAEIGIEKQTRYVTTYTKDPRSETKRKGVEL